MRSSVTIRLRFLSLVLVGVAALIVLRLYDVQVIQHEQYSARRSAQQGERAATSVERGSIYMTERTGSRMLAAGTAYGYTLAIDPRKVSTSTDLFVRIAPHVPTVTAHAIAHAQRDPKDPYEEIARKVSKQQVDALIASGTPKGLIIAKDAWRTYPSAPSAAQTIGIIGFGAGSSTAKSGLYGLERTYNDALVVPTESTGSTLSRVSTRLLSSTKEPGADVITSLEPTVQARLEEVLATYQKTWSPSAVGGVILNPATGEILGMAALPTFDSSNVETADIANLSNPMVERVYEFGSTMKPLTMAAAIDAGLVTPASTYTDTGEVRIADKTVANYDRKARGVVSMQEVLSQSLNVGIAHIVKLLGAPRMHTYFQKFGLTEETGVDLPGEASPITGNIETERLLELTNAGFGQGIAVTPLAMARALAALANDGLLVQPHVATKLEYPGGVEKRLGWSPERRAVSEEAAETVTDMLVKVVDTALKGGAARVDTMSIAAKTGTAQIPSPNGGYYTDRYLHSFFTYFPASKPQFLVFLFAVEPKGATYAADTWVSSFKDLSSFLISYYQVPPDRMASSTLQ